MLQISFLSRIFLIYSPTPVRNSNRITHSPRRELPVVKRTKLSLIQPGSINFRQLDASGSWRIRHRDPAHVWTQRGLKSNEDTLIRNRVERFENCGSTSRRKSRGAAATNSLSRAGQEKDAEWKFSDPARYRPLSRLDSIRAPVELRLIKGQIELEVGRVHRSAERGKLF